jgi:hypothetical protein
MSDRTKQNTNHICFTKTQTEDETCSCVSNLEIWVKMLVKVLPGNFSVSVTVLQNEKPKQGNKLGPYKSASTYILLWSG